MMAKYLLDVLNFVKNEKQNLELGQKRFTNVYIKNFGEDMDDERLKDLFGKFGNVSELNFYT